MIVYAACSFSPNLLNLRSLRLREGAASSAASESRRAALVTTGTARSSATSSTLLQEVGQKIETVGARVCRISFVVEDVETGPSIEFQPIGFLVSTFFCRTAVVLQNESHAFALGRRRTQCIRLGFVYESPMHKTSLRVH